MMQTQLAHNTVNKVEVCLFSFLFLTTVCLQWRIQRRVRAMQLPTGIGLQQFFAHEKYNHWLTCKLGTFFENVVLHFANVWQTATIRSDFSTLNAQKRLAIAEGAYSAS